MEWSEYHLDRLHEYWHARKEDRSHLFTTAQIGDRLGRSKNAVIGKAHRLDLEPRPSPILRGVIPKDRNIDRHRPRQTTFKTNRGLPSAKPPSPPVAVRPVMAPPPPRPAPERPYGRIINCCWPISERPYRFCGDTSEPGKPYCAEHAKLAYVPKPKRVLEKTGD